MFCRIEILTRDAKAGRVIATRYTSGTTLEDLTAFADSERKKHQAEGFRVYDLHTGQTEEIWNLG